MNIGVHILLQIMVFSGYMHRSRIAGLYSSLKITPSRGCGWLGEQVSMAFSGGLCEFFVTNYLAHESKKWKW